MTGGNGELAIADQVWSHYYTATQRRLTAKDMDVPPLPPEAIHYLRMRLRDLTPNEYWATSRYDMEIGLVVQDARDRGIEDAREMYGKQEK